MYVKLNLNKHLGKENINNHQEILCSSLMGIDWLWIGTFSNDFYNIKLSLILQKQNFTFINNNDCSSEKSYKRN